MSGGANIQGANVQEFRGAAVPQGNAYFLYIQAAPMVITMKRSQRVFWGQDVEKFRKNLFWTAPTLSTTAKAVREAAVWILAVNMPCVATSVCHSASSSKPTTPLPADRPIRNQLRIERPMGFELGWEEAVTEGVKGRRRHVWLPPLRLTPGCL